MLRMPAAGQLLGRAQVFEVGVLGISGVRAGEHTFTLPKWAEFLVLDTRACISDPSGSFTQRVRDGPRHYKPHTAGPTKALAPSAAKCPELQQ